jgi:hypothetical protein
MTNRVKLDLHAIQLGEVTLWGVSTYSSGILVSGCPGPGSSWGDLTVPPPSKEGDSPSSIPPPSPPWARNPSWQGPDLT